MLDSAVEKLKGKDKNNFKQCIKMYESKKYGKGLKLAQKILKSNPKHAESHSLQALFKCYTTGEKDKYEIEAKNAMKLDFKSAFCWNICGMIQKMNKKYKIAAMSFTCALKYDPNNQQIMREATNLFLLSKDYVKHLEYRKKMLFSKPGIMMNWAGFICGNHLNGDIKPALDAMDSLLDMDTKKIKENKSNKNLKAPYAGIMSSVEKNNLNLYRLKIYAESEMWQDLIDWVAKKKRDITDKLQQHKYLIMAHEALGNHKEVRDSVDTLLQYIPENEEHILKFIESGEKIGIDRQESIDVLKARNKRSKLIPKIILRSLDSSDPAFKQAIHEQYINACRKVSPTFFRELKQFYSDSAKVAIIEEILTSNLKTLEAGFTFESTPDVKEFPTTLMYAYYVLAWHFYFKKDYESALEMSKKCEEHTPTFIENAILKAKILKGLYLYSQAADVLKEYYKLDKADRYIINKTAKYMMDNNDIKEGDKLFKIVLMNKKDAEKTIHNLQKMWYEIIQGRAYIRQRKWGRGLRQFEFIKNNINTMNEDQLDFYSFALRKYSLSRFVDMVRFNTTTILKDKRYVEGLGYYLKSGVRYLRNKVIDDKIIEEKTEGLKAIQKRQFLKEFNKYKSEDSVEASKALNKELDLDGTTLLEDFKLEGVAKMCSVAQPQTFKSKKLVYKACFDYWFSVGNSLNAIKFYKKLTTIYKEDHLKLTMRRILLLQLVEKTLANPETNETTLKYLKKYFTEFSTYKYSEELAKLDERAKSCPLARCYSIAVRGIIGEEYDLIQTKEKLQTFATGEFSDKVTDYTKKIASIVIKTLNAFSVDVTVCKELTEKAGMELGNWQC